MMRQSAAVWVWAVVVDGLSGSRDLGPAVFGGEVVIAAEAGESVGRVEVGEGEKEEEDARLGV
jgi:hypothetical protein